MKIINDTGCNITLKSSKLLLISFTENINIIQTKKKITMKQKKIFIIKHTLFIVNFPSCVQLTLQAR